MDSGTIRDRTAAWQAVVLYSQENQLPALDEDVEEVQNAFNDWQSKLTEFQSREWDWEVCEAEEKKKDAFDAMSTLPKKITSAGMKRRRETWYKARDILEELEATHREAERQVTDA
ncbi:MAG: hypothetical protein L0H96_11110 [Humibacillus sp.]|nr:hypothetical protein [Humibacillus sp.]MDN5777451.1 hypothetical protein [Humibacillus sp.]